MHATAPKRIARQLARVPSGQQRVVTCYVRLEPADRVGRKWLHEVKAAIDALARAGEALDRTSRAALDRDFQRVLGYLSDTANLPRAPGLALFACSPVRLFAVVPLPRVSRTRVVVDRRPMLDELWAAEREFGRVLAAVLDRRHARLFEVTAFGAEEIADLHSARARGGRYHGDRRGSPGSGERNYHNRIRQEHHRHYAAVAEWLGAAVRDRAVEGILLAAPGGISDALRRFLSPGLAQRVIGVARLNPMRTTADEVAAAVRAARESHAVVVERGLALAVRQGLGTGWAENGLEGTLRDLTHGRVRHLVVRADAAGAGFRCATTGRLVQRADQCRGEGAPRPVRDLIGAAVEEAHRQGVPVTVLQVPDAARKIDGIAALLRFR